MSQDSRLQETSVSSTPETSDFIALQDDLHQVNCQLKALAHALPRFYEDGVDADTGAGVDWLFNAVLIQLEDVAQRLAAYPESTMTVDFLDLKRQANALLKGKREIAVS